MSSLDYLSSRVLVQYHNTTLVQPKTKTEKLTHTFLQLTNDIDQINFLDNPDNIATDRLNKAKVKTRLVLAEFQAQSNTADFDLLFAATTFADKLKKRYFENHTIWNSLDNNQKNLLDKLAPLYQSPDADDSVVFRPDSTLLAPNRSYDFGDRAFIAVTQFKVGSTVWFDLRNHPGAKLGKPCDSMPSEVEFVDENGLVAANLGRLGDIFKLEKWKVCFIISDQFYDLGSNKSQGKAQLQEMYRFYWQSMVETLGLPVAKPIAVSSEGEWLIKSKEQFTTPLSEIDLKELPPASIKKLAEDIHRHLLVEQKYNINILGLLDSLDVFGVTGDGKCVVDMLKPLPAFFEMNAEGLARRHQNFLNLLGKFPALQNAVQELYTGSLKEVSEYKSYIQSLSDFKGLTNSPRDILRAYLLSQFQVADPLVTDTTEEEVELYTLNFLDFLKSKSKPTLEDENFKEFILKGHQDLEIKLHSRCLVYLCQRLPDVDNWEQLLNFLQKDAQGLFQRLSEKMKNNLVPLPSDGWKSIEEQLEMQVEVEFMQKLEVALSEFVSKNITSNHFFNESLALFVAQSIQIKNLGNKSNLNNNLTSFLHNVMHSKAREVFVHSLRNHLKT